MAARDSRGRFLKRSHSRRSRSTALVRASAPRQEQVVIVDERPIRGEIVDRYGRSLRGRGRRRSSRSLARRSEVGIVKGTIGAVLGGIGSGLTGAYLTARGWSTGAAAFAVGVGGALVAWFWRKNPYARIAGITALAEGAGTLFLGGNTAAAATGGGQSQSFWDYLWGRIRGFILSAGPNTGGSGRTGVGATET